MFEEGVIKIADVGTLRTYLNSYFVNGDTDFQKRKLILPPKYEFSEVGGNTNFNLK